METGITQSPTKDVLSPTAAVRLAVFKLYLMPSTVAVVAAKRGRWVAINSRRRDRVFSSLCFIIYEGFGWWPDSPMTAVKNRGMKKVRGFYLCPIRNQVLAYLYNG